MPTNAELAKENKELKAQLDEQDAKLNLLLARGTGDKPGTAPYVSPPGPKDVVRDDNPGDGGGWVIKTPDQMRYDKKTGQQKQVFFSGETEGVRFVNNYGFVYTNRKNADLIVHRLEHDFGYTVTPLGKEEMGEFRSQFDNMQPEEVKTGMEKLAQPQVFA